MEWVLLVIGIGVLLIILISIYDMHKLKLKKYSVTTNKINANVRIVFLSDLHSNFFGKDNRRLLKKIDQLNPDMVLIGGDMIVTNLKKDFDVAINLINTLTQKYKVYYAIGNHEYRLGLYREKQDSSYEEYFEAIKSSNLKVLDNDTIKLEKENIVLSGLTLDKNFYIRLKKITCDLNEINSALGMASYDSFHILLAHNPTFFLTYDAWGADLTLSGHLHGGIVKLPILGGLISAAFEFFPKFDGGRFQGKNGELIVSRGLGSHTIPIRVFNPCELVCIDLEKEETL